MIALSPQQERDLSLPKERVWYLPIVLNDTQRSILLAFYNLSNHPSCSQKKVLAEMTGISVERVTKWFSYQRSKSKQVEIAN